MPRPVIRYSAVREQSEQYVITLYKKHKEQLLANEAKAAYSLKSRAKRTAEHAKVIAQINTHALRRRIFTTILPAATILAYLAYRLYGLLRTLAT